MYVQAGQEGLGVSANKDLVKVHTDWTQSRENQLIY